MKRINIKQYEDSVYENPLFDKVVNIDHYYTKPTGDLSTECFHRLVLNIHVHNLRIDINVSEWK